MVKCQMKCGACKNRATLRLVVKASEPHHMSKLRDIYSCDLHETELDKCGRMYGVVKPKRKIK